jgi:hypothetical protein
VIALDPEATLPCCERAHAFLKAAQDGHRPDDDAAAEAWAERWRQRDAMERERAAQIEQVDPNSSLVAATLDADTLARLRALVQQGPGQRWVRRVWLARRVIPADPGAMHYLLGVELSWWGRRRGKQAEVVHGLARLEWPIPVFIVSLDGRFKPLKSRFEALGPSPSDRLHAAMFAASFNNRRILKSVATVTIGEQSVEVHALEVDPNGIALIATFNPPVGTEMEVEFVLARAGRRPRRCACRPG